MSALLSEAEKWQKQGQWALAADCYYRALLKSPHEEKLWPLFAYAVKTLQFPRDDQTLTQVLAACFQMKGMIDPQHLAVPAMSLLKFQRSYEGFRNHPLFLPLLANCLVPDPFFEKVVTAARKELLFGLLDDPLLEEAIASHCYLNEYIYDVSVEELERASGSSLYFPIGKEAQEEALQVADFADKMPCLKPIADRVSLAVAEQYEQNPYPRWTALTRLLQQMDSKEVLIAGCGTGQHALRSAWQFPNRRFLAIDLSRRSLGYACYKAKLLGINNIAFMQADILDLGTLPNRFDEIECVGVLHHMDKPGQGLQILVGLLKAAGRINLGLYSELGRRDVVAARGFAGEGGYNSSLSSMRACRQALLQLPDEHPAKAVTQTVDFYCASSFRDLVFHAQEHRFSLSEVRKLLEDNKLCFEGFELADRRLMQQYQEMFPDDAEGMRLESWMQFEQAYPETFSGMYQFWAKRADS